MNIAISGNDIYHNNVRIAYTDGDILYMLTDNDPEPIGTFDHPSQIGDLINQWLARNNLLVPPAIMSRLRSVSPQSKT